MFKRILAGILSAVIVFSSLSPAVNAVESVAISQEEITDQEAVEEEITEEEKGEDKIESEIEESVEEIEIKEEQMVETTIIEEVVAEEQIAQTLNTAAPIDESERGEIATGACGDNLTWVLYKDGELVISGEGAMDIGATSHYSYPWKNYRDEVTIITISETISSIGDYAFDGYSNLTRVTIPENVISIGKCAFMHCSSLKEISFPISLINIGDNAFSFCEFESIHYAGTWEEWSTLKNEFENFDSVVITKQNYVYKDNDDGTVTIIGAGEGGLGGKIQIPEEINGLKVTAIGESAFMKNTEIKAVEIPSSVEIIGKNAFYECDLESISFSEGLKKIGDNAFYSASSKSDLIIELPKGLKNIGKYAFAELWYGVTFEIPDSVESIGFEAFSHGYEITFLGDAQKWIDVHNTNTSALPPISNVTFLGNGQAFALYTDYSGNCNSYQLVTWKDASGDVVIPSTYNGLPVTSIKNEAFAKNTTITSVVIPQSVTSIGDYAFSECSKLENAVIDAAIYYLPYEMFGNCVLLKSVSLPYTVTEIHEGAFKQCIKLETVYYDSEYNWETMKLGNEIGNGNDQLYEANLVFQHDWGYELEAEYYDSSSGKPINSYIIITGKTVIPENLVVPESIKGIPVKEIEENAFKNCTELLSVLLPKDIDEIGWCAFGGCEKLKTIRLPEKVTRINGHAFENCVSLKEIFIETKKNIYFGCHTFSGCINIEKITILSETIRTIGYICENPEFDYDYAVESIFEGVPINAEVRVVKGSSAYRFMEEFGFTTLVESVVLREITLPKSVSVELGKSKSLLVTKVPSNANETLEPEWSSADDSIAKVDKDGKITGLKMGNVQIIVKDKISEKTARTTVQVVLPAKSKISVKTDPVIDTIGLQTGESVTMRIFATELGTDESLSPALFTFTSSDDSIATVDENGVITSVYNGTKSLNVKITAALKNDSAARKVYLSVKTIPVQIETLGYYFSEEIEAIGDTYVVPKSKVKDADYQIQVYAQPLSATEELLTPTLKWTTSNSKVATVSKDGLVTVKKNADGIAKITATVNDLKKASISFEIDVRDYNPRLAANTVTLNTNTFNGAQVQMYPVYGTDITSVRLEGNDSFDVNYISKDGIHTLNVVADGVVKNGTYKLTLISTIEGIGEYEQSFNVKVANSVPAITLKQKAPFNLFYSDNEAIVSVAAKNAVISNMELSDTETFKGEFNEYKQELVISYNDKDSILDKKATVTVTLKDYRNPITKTFNINAKETKPTLAVSRKSTSLSALIEKGVPLQITNKALNKPIDWDEDKCYVSVADTSIAYVTTTHEGTDLTIQPILDENKFANGKTSHSAKLEIRGENWLKPIVVTHTISIVTKNPTIKVSQSTLTLNSLFGNKVETTIVPSLSNCPKPYAYEFKAAKELEDYKKIKLEVEEGWKLKVSFEDPDELPAKGNYKYDVFARIDGVEEPVKTTVTIKVAESKPKVTLEKSSISLNKMISDQIDFAAKITAGYEITDMKISNATGNVLGEEQLAVAFNPETGRVHVEILDGSIANKTYKYNLTPTVKMDGIEKEVPINPVVLSVKVYGNNASISATGKGSIDLVTREEGILYTITGGKNFNYHVDDIEYVTLVGADAELFDIEVLEANAKGQSQIKVKAKESVDFSTAVTYKYKLAAKINHLEKEVESAEFKIKVKQSALSLKAQGDLTVYQSVKNGKILVEVVKPVDAKVKEMQILETKATTVPEDALSYELEKNADGSHVLNYQVTNPGKLKANAGYKLSFAVISEGNASNKTAQTFTVTLKVKR